MLFFYIDTKYGTVERLYGKRDVTFNVTASQHSVALFEQNRHSVDKCWAVSSMCDKEFIVENVDEQRQKKTHQRATHVTETKLCSGDDVKYIGISMLFYLLQTNGNCILTRKRDNGKHVNSLKCVYFC